MIDLHFENLKVFFRTVVELDEDDIQLVLKPYNSISVTYELSPWNYTIKGTSEAVFNMGDHEGNP